MLVAAPTLFLFSVQNPYETSALEALPGRYRTELRTMKSLPIFRGGRLEAKKENRSVRITA